MFDGNSAEIYGGAMYVTANTAAPAGLILDNVTFSANSAGFDGGAIFNLTDDSFLPLALFNATFAGNSALRAGGAIDNSGTGMDLVLSNVILWNNTASAGENQIHYSPNTPSARIDHSIVQGGDAGSHRADGVPDTAFGSGTGNLATDPLLGPLQDNGGFTLTFLPARDGSAIDTGTCDLFEDQRGVPRPLGGSCDIGAVELDPYPIFASGFEPDTTP